MNFGFRILDFRFWTQVSRPHRRAYKPGRCCACAASAGVFLSLCAMGLLVPLPASAQESKPKEAPVIELSATMLGDTELPPLFYVDVKRDEKGKEVKEFKPFAVSRSSRSPATKIPFLASMQLFAGRFDEKGKPDMKPYLEIPAKKPGDRLLLVFHLDSKGSPQQTFLDDSAATHPPGTVRMVNFSPDRIAFSAGGSPVKIAAGGQAMTEPVITPEGRFPFIYFVERGGQKPYQSPTKLLSFRKPGSRLLVAYTAMPTEIPTGEQNADGSDKTVTEYQPVACRLYDSIGSGIAAANGTSSKPSATPAPTPQDQTVNLIALEGAVPANSEIEMLWDGQGATSKAKVVPGKLTAVKAPAAGGMTLRLSNGTPVGSAHFSNSSRQHLLVLSPGEDSLGAATVSSFENSLQSHPAGAVRVFNLTPYQLAYSAGNKIAYVNPKEEAVIEFPSGENSLKLAVKANDGWKLVMDTKPVKPQSNERNLLFVSKSLGKDEFNIQEVSQ